MDMTRRGAARQGCEERHMRYQKEAAEMKSDQTQHNDMRDLLKRHVTKHGRYA